jgi:glycosyltransferase involved in cell wall biosynthesis
MKPRALVIEPNFSGHRSRYVEWTIEALIEAGYECTLSTKVENRDHPLIRSYEQPQSHVTVIWHGGDTPSATALRALLSLVRNDFVFYTWFASAYRATTRTQVVDLVVVPYADYILNAVAILGSPFDATRWICITMRQTFHLRKMGVKVPRRPLLDFLKKQLFVRALRQGNIAAVFSIDPTLALWHASSPLAEHPPCVTYLADPFPEIRPLEKSEAKARLGITAEYSILVYGAITERKGIIALLNTCMKLDDHPLIIIAGQQDEQIHTYLASVSVPLAGRIAIFNHFISPEMETDLFSACDAVWIAYKDHYGMSGVLVQAYRFGKVVIATSVGLIGWFAKRDRLGPLLNDLSIPAIRTAIDQAIGYREMDRSPPFLRDYEQFLAKNTVRNFKDTIKLTIIMQVAST